MKKIILCIVISQFSILAFSQQDSESDKQYRTLLDGVELRISGMGGPMMQFTSVSGEFAHMMGGGGAVMLNNFFIGGYGTGLTNFIPDDRNDEPRDRLSLGHGGFWIGYSLFGHLPVHASVSAQVGWGEFGIIRDGLQIPDRTDFFFAFTPIVELEANITRYFRMGAGATYNIYSGLNGQLGGYTSSDIGGPGAFLSFKFGWF